MTKKGLSEILFCEIYSVPPKLGVRSLPMRHSTIKRQ